MANPFYIFLPTSWLHKFPRFWRNRRPHLAVWHTQTALPPGPQLRLLPVDWAGPQGFRPERIWEPSVDTMMYVYGNTCIHLIICIYAFMYGIWACLKMVALWKFNENDDDTLKSGGFSRFSRESIRSFQSLRACSAPSPPICTTSFHSGRPCLGTSCPVSIHKPSCRYIHRITILNRVINQLLS